MQHSRRIVRWPALVVIDSANSASCRCRVQFSNSEGKDAEKRLHGKQLHSNFPGELIEPRVQRNRVTEAEV